MKKNIFIVTLLIFTVSCSNLFLSPTRVSLGDTEEIVRTKLNREPTRITETFLTTASSAPKKIDSKTTTQELKLNTTPNKKEEYDLNFLAEGDLKIYNENLNFRDRSTIKKYGISKVSFIIIYDNNGKVMQTGWKGI